MSNELDIKFPEISYDETKATMYQYLKDDPESPFHGHTYATIFIFAMALAKRDGLLPENLEKSAKMPPNAFDGNMRTLMRSIMIDEKHDVYRIRDNIALRNMCQRYANVGIDRLYLSIKNKPVGKEGEDVLIELIQSKS